MVAWSLGQARQQQGETGIVSDCVAATVLSQAAAMAHASEKLGLSNICLLLLTVCVAATASRGLRFDG
jgi:hypothetical protein